MKTGFNSQNHRLIWEKDHSETPRLWFGLVTISLLVHIVGLAIIHLWWQQNQSQQNQTSIDLMTVKSTSEAKTEAIKPIKVKSSPPAPSNSNSQGTLSANSVFQPHWQSLKQDLPDALPRPLAIPLDNPQSKPPRLSAQGSNSGIPPISPQNSSIYAKPATSKQSQPSDIAVSPNSKAFQQPLPSQSEESNLGLWQAYEPNIAHNQKQDTSISTIPGEITTNSPNQLETRGDAQSLLPPPSSSNITETQDQANLGDIPTNSQLNPPLTASSNITKEPTEDINDVSGSLVATIGNFSLSNSGGAIPSQLAEPIENMRSLDTIDYLASDINIKGTVILETLVVIDDHGKPTVLPEYTKIVEGDLDSVVARNLAREIIESWTFKPTYQDNQPTFGDYKIQIELRGDR